MGADGESVELVAVTGEVGVAVATGRETAPTGVDNGKKPFMGGIGSPLNPGTNWRPGKPCKFWKFWTF